MPIGETFRASTGLAGVNSLNAFHRVNRDLLSTPVHLATGLPLNETADTPANFTLTSALNARSRGQAVAQANVTPRGVPALFQSSLIADGVVPAVA